MTTNDQLCQQMWDLVYGLCSAEETLTLHAQIQRDPAAARLYAEVCLQADLVADAAKVDEAAHPLPTQSPPERTVTIRPIANQLPTAKRRGGKHRPHYVNWPVGLIAISLAVLLCFTFVNRSAGDKQLADAVVVTELEAPAELQAGVSQQVAVRTSDATDAGCRAEVDFRVVDLDGTERYRRQVRTDEIGRAVVNLPAESFAALQKKEVRLLAKAVTDDAASPAADDPSTAALEAKVIPEPLTTFVLCDQPVYQPGETANIAVLTLGRFSKQLSDSPDRTTAYDTAGSQKSLNERTLGYRLSKLAVSERLPGEKHYPFEVAEGRPLSDQLADAGGPARVLDRKSLENAVEQSPEPNALAFGIAGATRTRYGSNQRSRGGLFGSSLAGDEAENLPSPSAAPSASTAGALPATAAKKIEHDLESIQLRDNLNLEQPPRAADRNIGAGQELDFAIPPDYFETPLLLTATASGRLVASAQFSAADTSLYELSHLRGMKAVAADQVEAEPRVVTLPAPVQVDGVISMRLYDVSQQPSQLLKEELVYRQPTARLQIQLSQASDVYEVGDVVRFQVQVTDERSQPTAATLGVRVWNERLRELAGTAPETIEQQVDQLDSHEPRGDLAQDDFAKQKGISTAEDFGNDVAGIKRESESRFAGGFGGGLKAGGSGSFGMVAGGASAATSPPLALRKLAASNRAGALAAHDRAIASQQHIQQERYAKLGRFLLIGGIAAGLLMGLQVLLRAKARAIVWWPACGLAVASALTGFMWIRQVPNAMQLALAPTPPKTTAVAPTDTRTGAGAAPSDRAARNSARAVDTERHEFDTRGSVLESDSVAIDPEMKRQPGPSLAGRWGAGAAADGEKFSRVDRAAGDRRQLDALQEDASAPAEPRPAVTDAAPSASFSAPEPSPAALEMPAPPATEPAAAAAKPESLTAAAESIPPAPQAPPAGPPPAAAPADEVTQSRALAADGVVKEVETGRPTPSGQAVRAGSLVRPKDDPDLPTTSDDQFGDTLQRTADTDAEPSQSLTSQRIAAAYSAPASLYFNPKLETGSDGCASFEFALPAVECEYRVLVDGLSSGRLGSAQVIIRCREKEPTE